MQTQEQNKGKTAVIVIHGIGEQNPFETLDSFTRGLFKGLRDAGRSCTAKHGISERSDPQTGTWTESYVQLTPGNGSGETIDVHEYYWAYMTEEKITLPEIIDWVENTLRATKSYYRKNPKLASKYTTFKLSRVSWLLMGIGLVYPLFRLVAPIARAFSRYLPVRLLDWMTAKVRKLATKIITGYIGDIAIYTTTDQKSKFFPIRQRVLANAQGLIESILKDNSYAKVVVAGHSLGSVIAYDSLNRLNIKANRDQECEKAIKKIQGLITFGSPLDKVAFFFADNAKQDQYVRRQIMEQLHSFKAKPSGNIPAGDGGFPIENSIESKLDGIRWSNYYSQKDPISGELDFYTAVDNVKLELPEKWGVAHIGYWNHEQFYKHIIAKHLT